MVVVVERDEQAAATEGDTDSSRVRVCLRRSLTRGEVYGTNNGDASIDTESSMNSLALDLSVLAHGVCGGPLVTLNDVGKLSCGTQSGRCQ